MPSALHRCLGAPTPAATPSCWAGSSTTPPDLASSSRSKAPAATASDWPAPPPPPACPCLSANNPTAKPDAARQNLGQIRPDRRPPRRTVRPRSASTPSTADPARPAHPARRPPRRILPPVVATALVAVGRTQVRDRHLRFHEDRDNLGAGCPARWPAWSARPGVRRSRSPTPPAAPATQPARRPPTTPSPLVSPASRRAQTTAPTRGSTGPGPARAPTPAACVERSPVRGDPPQRGTRGRPVQVNSLAPKLLRVVLTGHDRGSSRFPSRGRIQRVHDQGSRPGNADAAAGRLGDWRRASERLERTSVGESGAVVTDLGQHAGAGDVAKADERWSTGAVPPGGSRR